MHILQSALNLKRNLYKLKLVLSADKNYHEVPLKVENTDDGADRYFDWSDDWLVNLNLLIPVFFFLED